VWRGLLLNIISAAWWVPFKVNAAVLQRFQLGFSSLLRKCHGWMSFLVSERLSSILVPHCSIWQQLYDTS
jgi:hypothetical protein